jgi:putative transposase
MLITINLGVIFMGKRAKNESPQRQVMRELMQEYLKIMILASESMIVISIMKDMMSVLLKGALDEELCYSNYGYYSNLIKNSRNGHSLKQCIPHNTVSRDRNLQRR